MSVLLAGSAAEGQTESASRQTGGLTTVARMLWARFAPSTTGTAEGDKPAKAHTNPEDAVPAVKSPTAGVAPPAPATALDSAVARKKIEVLLLQKCIACHGPNSPVVPQFDVTRFESLVRNDYLVPGQPDRSQILKRVKAGRMPPPQRPPLTEQDKGDLESWITVDPRPQLKGIVDTLRDDLRLTKLVELGTKAKIIDELQVGGTLVDLATTAKWAQGDIVELVARVADAVHFAHTHGLVHCDLKPANILIDGNGDPKVADFGLAVLESEQSHRKGERSGTPKYMSPEQVLGHVERLDGRTDIWSLGATLYELLTRRPPFSGETRAELFDQILHRDVKPPRQINDKIPAALERICLKALSKQPADRYSTARDFARDLRQVAQPPTLRRLHQLAYLLGGLVVVLIGVLIVVSLNPPKIPSRDHLPVSTDVEPEPPPRPEREFELPGVHLSAVTSLAGSSRYVVSRDGTGAVCLWDLIEKRAVGIVDARRAIWQMGFSGDGQLLATLHADRPYVRLQSIPALTRIEAGAYTGSPPEILLPATDQRSVWTVVPLENALQILEFPRGVHKYTLPVTGSWSCLTGAHVEGYLVLAGFVAEEQKWRLVQWQPGALSPDEAPRKVAGAVCSVALSKERKVVLGGYGPDLGVQVYLPGKQPLRLDNDKQEDRLYYHEVAISDNDEYVFALSRYIPPPGDSKPEHAVLRVWPITGETPVEEVNRPCVRVDTLPPVEAVMFLPDQQRFLLASGHTVEVWGLK